MTGHLETGPAVRRVPIVPDTGMCVNGRSDNLDSVGHQNLQGQVSTITTKGLLGHDRLRHLLDLRCEMLLLQETHAGVPTKDRIVIPGHAEALRLFEESQRVDNPFVDVLTRALAAAHMPRFRSAFPCNPRVVGAIVRAHGGSRS